MNKFSFDIDCSGETREVTKHWQFCVGSGHAALAQRADYLEQLKIVHNELGIERVRFHGIFNDDMNVCVRLEDHLPFKTFHKTKVYSFYQIGKIYDNLLKIGVRPFVELGFMPSALALGKKTVFYYKGNVTMPKKMDEWQDFIRAFANFLINRYGAEEVRTWFFEVWNEPDLDCFFKGNMQDYFRLYGATVKALKSVDDKLIVGGPATTRGQHIPAFLDYCKKNNVPIDFVSTHQYPTDALGHSLNSERLRRISKTKTTGISQSLRGLLQPIFDGSNVFTPDLKGYMTREIERARKDTGNLPLYYTEWSISSNCVAAIHDTVKSSSFLVKTVLDTQGMMEGSSYWTFSDIFEELFFFPDPFCGGFGLMTVDGIRKPTFWAFKMLKGLPNIRYCLPVTNDDVEIAAFKADNGSIYIMIYAQNFIDNDNVYEVSIELENTPQFTSAAIQRINKEYGNPVALWEKKGNPPVLNPYELEEIKASSLPKTETVKMESSDGNVIISVKITTNETALLVLK